MTIQKAIKIAKEEDEWFRPIGSIGFAYCVKNGSIYLVPSSNGGVLATLAVSDIIGKWEVVHPTIVFKENSYPS